MRLNPRLLVPALSVGLKWTSSSKGVQSLGKLSIKGKQTNEKLTWLSQPGWLCQSHSWELHHSTCNDCFHWEEVGQTYEVWTWNLTWLKNQLCKKKIRKIWRRRRRGTVLVWCGNLSTEGAVTVEGGAAVWHLPKETFWFILVHSGLNCSK